jgi:hypothetical protein
MVCRERQREQARDLLRGGILRGKGASITLMRGELTQILDFLNLAARVAKKIRQNLVFSGLYNIIAIPIAKTGLLNPLVAVAAMLLSCLSVIGNTRLLIRRPNEFPLTRSFFSSMLSTKFSLFSFVLRVAITLSYSMRASLSNGSLSTKS